MGARLKFGQRSRVPKKGSRDEAVEIPPARKPRYFEWSAHQCAGKRIGRGPYICQSCQSLKHFTTASEIKSYQEHLQKNKPPEMVNIIIIIYYLFGANIYMNIFKCALQVTLK